MVEIVVPKLNNNDEGCVLIEWRAASGEAVEVGDVIAVLETSKAVHDFECPVAGILHCGVEEGEEVLFGAVMGHVFPDEDARQAHLARPAAPAVAEGGELTITKDARELIAAHGLTEADLLPLGKRVIRSRDVEALLAARKGTGPQQAGAAPELQPGETLIELPRRQVAVARTVTQSHQTIPVAYLLMRIYCDEMLGVLREVSKRERIMAGLPAVLIKLVAGLSEEFPFFFGRMLDERRFAHTSDPGIGVTFDLGSGLFIPVIKSPRSKTLKEIAIELTDLRNRAMRGEFKQEDLSGGHISLSLNTDRDVVLVVPIVLPGQTSMIVIGAVLAEETEGRRRSYFNLGVAYDHRAVNGHQAVELAKAVKERVEHPSPDLKG